MVKRGTVWVPTVDHNRYYIDAKDEFGFAPGVEGPLKDYIQRNLASVAKGVKLGVKIGMGSDAVYTMFGQNTRELEWLVKAGMTPTQALATATTTAAELLGMSDRLGRIAPGYLAEHRRDRWRSDDKHRADFQWREVGHEGRTHSGRAQVSRICVLLGTIFLVDPRQLTMPSSSREIEMAEITLNEGLAWLKTLRKRHEELIALRDANANRERRFYGATDREFIKEPVYDVKSLDLTITRIAREIRLLDQAMKATNAKTPIAGYEQDDAVLGELS